DRVVLDPIPVRILKKVVARLARLIHIRHPKPCRVTPRLPTPRPPPHPTRTAPPTPLAPPQRYKSPRQNQHRQRQRTHHPNQASSNHHAPPRPHTFLNCLNFRGKPIQIRTRYRTKNPCTFGRTTQQKASPGAPFLSPQILQTSPRTIASPL